MDLNSMFQNLGPAGGAMLTGMDMRNTQNEQESQQAYRQAQMDEIMQRTAQQKLMNPLDLQAKQQSLDTGKLALETGGLANKKAQLELDAAPLEIQVKNLQRSSQLLGAASTHLSTVPPLKRHAALLEYAQENGVNINSPTIKGLWNQLYSVKGEDIPKVLNAFRENVMKQESSVYSHLEGLRLSGQNQKDIEGMREAARAKLQKEKLNTVATYEAELAKAKSPSQKAAVALAWALKTADPEEQVIFKQHAKAFEDQSKQLNSQTIAAEAQKEAMDRLRNKTPITNQPRDLTKGTTKSGISFTVTPTTE